MLSHDVHYTRAARAHVKTGLQLYRYCTFSDCLHGICKCAESPIGFRFGSMLISSVNSQTKLGTLCHALRVRVASYASSSAVAEKPRCSVGLFWVGGR